MSYEIGSLVTIKASFVDSSGAPADPTSVTLVIRAPDGTEATQTYNPGNITKESVGVYIYYLAPTLPGIYSFRWVGTGSVQAVIDSSITIETSLLAGARPNAIDLCRLDDVKDWLGQVDDKQDVTLQRIITSFSHWWLWQTGRGTDDGTFPEKSPFVEVVDYDEEYDGNGNDRLPLRNSPVRSVTALYVDGLSIPSSSMTNSPGYVVDGSKKAVVLRGGRYTRGYGRAWYGGYTFSRGVMNVRVQYTAGYSATPPDIQDAAIKTVAYWYNTKRYIGYLTQTMQETLGTIKYKQDALPSGVQEVIDNYSRIPSV